MRFVVAGGEEIIASLRTRMSKKRPTHGIRLGDNSLRFRFPDISTPSCVPLMPSATLSAVFSVHISPSLGEEGLQELAQWIHSLNSDIQLSFETVYETEFALVIICRGRYSFFSDLPGIKFICETKPPTLCLSGIDNQQGVSGQ